MTQHALTLDGHCSGPLFAPPTKRRPPRRRPGTTDHGRIRRAAELRATPPWVDKVRLRELYREAERRTREQGVLWSVDHLVPLQHPLVRGLHWHGNMELALMAENNRKNNRTWPDAWEVQQELFDDRG